MEMMYNEIEGTLPLDLWLKLPKLQRLNIPVNNSTDLIPKSISNASQLVYLDIAENAFTGHWASARLERDCRALRGSVSSNLLGNNDEDDLYFVSFLSNNTKLRILAFSTNNLGGIFPKSISRQSF